MVDVDVDVEIVLGSRFQVQGSRFKAPGLRFPVQGKKKVLVQSEKSGA